MTKLLEVSGVTWNEICLNVVLTVEPDKLNSWKWITKVLLFRALKVKKFKRYLKQKVSISEVALSLQLGKRNGFGL